ncbi:MAG TPA: hypothetical protein VGM10_33635 [Actinocrinis sp.]|jgi:hypothetical protein
MNPRLRAAAEVVLVHGLLGWIYVAALAAVYPNALGQHIAAVLPLRRDTFGALAFAASALAAVSLQTRTGRFWARRSLSGPGLTRAVLNVVVVYGLLTWAYLCVNSLSHPWSTGLQVTHFVSRPSEGTTAVFCFAASAVCLFLVRSAAGDADGGARECTDDSGHG